LRRIMDLSAVAIQLVIWPRVSPPATCAVTPCDGELLSAARTKVTARSGRALDLRVRMVRERS
jgi:hypothetical protein